MAEINLERILKESEYIRRGFRDVVRETIEKLIPKELLKDVGIRDEAILKTVRERIENNEYLRGWVEVPDEHVKVTEK